MSLRHNALSLEALVIAPEGRLKCVGWSVSVFVFDGCRFKYVRVLIVVSEYVFI